MDQDPAARPARKAWHQGNFQVWMKELSDGSVAAGFFNTGKERNFEGESEGAGAFRSV
ncbi:MAG: hypothetical protein ACLT38_07100 [Akkermansia sp.]